MNPSRFFVNPQNMYYPRMIPNNASPFRRILAGVSALDLGKIMSGASKTLNVVNQTIPLIKQAKPMVSNVRSMLGLAKAFRNETNHTEKVQEKTNVENNYPTFFT